MIMCTHVQYNYVHVYVYLQWNTSHSITHVGFGDDYPGLINPLDNSQQVAQQGIYYRIIGMINNLFIRLYEHNRISLTLSPTQKTQVSKQNKMKRHF